MIGKKFHFYQFNFSNLIKFFAQMKQLTLYLVAAQQAEIHLANTTLAILIYTKKAFSLASIIFMVKHQTTEF